MPSLSTRLDENNRSQKYSNHLCEKLIIMPQQSFRRYHVRTYMSTVQWNGFIKPVKNLNTSQVNLIASAKCIGAMRAALPAVWNVTDWLDCIVIRASDGRIPRLRRPSALTSSYN